MFRLCLALGTYPHPDYLGELLSDRQVREWMLYAEIEPFGSPAIDQYVGLIRHATFQKGVKEDIDVQTCVPRWGPPAQLSAEDYKQKAMRKYAGQGATVAKG